MFYSKRRGDSENPDIWPGFVDALSTVLLVFIFVLVGFISSQIYLSSVIFDKDSSLSNLQAKFGDVCALLKLEKDKNSNLSDKNSDLSKQIIDLNNTIVALQKMFNDEELQKKEAITVTRSLQEKIEKLTDQLKDVIAALNAEQKTAEERQRTLDRIKNENIKLNELSRMSAYKSEFFDKLKGIVDGKNGVKVVGDRFIFQSELFFDSASDELSDDGKTQVSELAEVIKEIGEKIPGNIRWILRVDGHTDSRPITGGKFTSNWELSSARAISVVKYLIERGVEPRRLVAAGFGEHQQIDTGKSDAAFAKNRRIEFKLDER
ncbi:MAG: peptidoglycan-binding protein [Holosporales bacterium]|jgi:chemotaxis protein MotB|nr:peptidoglycan-binding protein [Holosporales bacterium]